MIRPCAHIDAMAPYALADLGPPGTVSLAQNESAFGPSPLAVAAGQQALAEAALYPDPDWLDLRSTIGKVHDINPDDILCGAGSMELIGTLIRAFVGPGEQIVGSQYGYAFVATAAAQCEAKYVAVPERDFTVCPDKLIDAITSDTRIVFLCNPGNPTGTLISNDAIARLHASLPATCLLVVDQAYGEFSDPVAPIGDLLARPGSENLCVLRTFSKAYALAGARVGWGVFPSHVAASMRKLLNPNNVSGVSQAMASAAMRDQPHMRKIVQQTAEIRDEFCTSCRDLNLTVPSSHTNFVLLGFRDPTQAHSADKALRENGYLMRAMGGYGLPNALRATVSDRSVMQAVTSILTEVLA